MTTTGWKVSAKLVRSCKSGMNPVALALRRGETTQITQRELRNNNGDIMRQLDQGESFVMGFPQTVLG